jgi:hypothetical protein
VWTQFNAVDGSRRVGAYFDGTAVHGALLDGETWQTLDYPGSNQTLIYGIDGSTVVGLYGPLGSHNGFMYDGVSWTELNYPGARTTAPRGISGSKIVGLYQDLSAGFHSFLRNGTTWTEIAFPGADWTNALDIDGDNIVGSYFKDDAFHGYLFDGVHWTTLDFPTALGTQIYSIAGEKVVGVVTEESGLQHGFIARVSSLDTFASVGDFNEDHIVDAADYVVWRQGLGSIYLPEQYDVWRAHFGQSVSDGSGSIASLGAVPEPSALLLIGPAASLFHFRSRKARFHLLHL